MAITGTEVAKKKARMILADDNFATIVAAVREDPAIVDNIRKFLRYTLTPPKRDKSLATGRLKDSSGEHD